MIVVCIGDSITAGQYLEPDESRWTELLTGYDVIPAGVNGDTTRLGLERFPRDVQERTPTAVVIQFGHNDANTWESDRGLSRVSSTAYGANLWEMVVRCRTFKAIPFLCTLTPVTGKPAAFTAAVEWYNSILRGVAASSKTQLVDVRTAFDEHDDLLLPDGIHLNANGHRVYAATVQVVLDRVLR